MRKPIPKIGSRYPPQSPERPCAGVLNSVYAPPLETVKPRRLTVQRNGQGRRESLICAVFV